MNPKAKILLIDDEPVFSNNFKAYMQMNEYWCQLAANGTEGMEKVFAEKPDVIILDILMPNMDGFTLLRELKKRGQTTPCIILTAREKLKDLFETEHIARFVSKPVELAKLKEIIEAVLREAKERKPMNPNGATPRPDISAQGKKILIIEDDARLAENVQKYLELKGYVVAYAANGNEGLSLCTAFSPDLIISDVMMPEMDGFSMIKQLQKGQMSIPVIIVTGRDKLKDLFEVEGVAGFIAKPFDMAELEKKICKVLQGE